MKVVYHPDVQRDVSRILRYYDGINERLGDEFWKELNSFINQASANPQHFHYGSANRRRVNLQRFLIIFFSGRFPAASASRLCAIINSILTTDSSDGSLKRGRVCP